MRYALLALALVSCTDSTAALPSEPDAATPRDAGSGGEDAQVDASIPDDPENCKVTFTNPEYSEDEPWTDTWWYDATTRHLAASRYEYDLDEEGRSIRVYGQGGGTLYWSNEYDERGNLAVNEHYTSGKFVYTNTYEDDRLVAVELAAPDGGSWKNTYRYDDPAAPTIWTRSELDLGPDGTIDSTVDRTLEDGRTATTRVSRNGAVHHEYTFTWDGERIDKIERDGGYWPGQGPDGTPNIRFRWKRDANNNVREFSQDGTDSLDNPFVNGKPDTKEQFSSGCAALLEQFPWLAHEPAPNSIGPRFRTEAE